MSVSSAIGLKAMATEALKFGRFWLVLAGCMLTGAVSPPAAGRNTRPNILWIIADDLATELSCYGTRLGETPNLDHLAAKGARYPRCFTTAPVCSTSRS